MSTAALGLARFAGVTAAGHPEPTTADDGKNGGRPDATRRFKHQGDRIRFVNTGKERRGRAGCPRGPTSPAQRTPSGLGVR